MSDLLHLRAFGSPTATGLVVCSLIGLFALRLASLKIHQTSQKLTPAYRSTGGGTIHAARRWEQIRRYVANEVTMSSRNRADEPVTSPEL